MLRSGLLRLLLFLLLSRGVGAQTLLPLPSDSMFAVVSLGQANEVLIEFANPGPDSLHLRWKLLEADLPAGWDVDLCDHGGCYTGIPSTGVMVPAPQGVNPYLKLIVQPGSMQGEAMISFRVYLAHDLNQAVTVHFLLATSATTGFPTQDTTRLRAYPNPVRDLLFLEYIGTKPMSAWRVFGPDGKQVAIGPPLTHGLHHLDVTSWPLGINYIVSPNGSIIPIIRQ